MEEATRLLKEHVAIESYTPGGQRYYLSAVRDYVIEHGLGDVLEQRFPDANSPDFNLLITTGQKGADEKLGFYSHIDTVKPHPEYAMLKENSPGLPAEYEYFMDRGPLDFCAEPGREYIRYGLGGYDMKEGVVVALMAIQEARLWTRRESNILLVGTEEDNSLNMHYARGMDPQKSNKTRFVQRKRQDLLKDMSCIVTGEIPVGAAFGHEPGIVTNRPGRVVVDITIKGRAGHSGIPLAEISKDRALYKSRRAQDLVETLRLPKDPRDRDGLLGKAQFNVVRAGDVAPVGMSNVDTTTFKVEVLHNTRFSPREILKIVRERLRPYLTLGGHAELDAGRNHPFLNPWFISPRHPYVQNVLEMSNETRKEGRYAQRARAETGKGTAEEALLALGGIPVVCIPPKGSGEHTAYERIDMRWLVRHQIPLHIRMLEYPDLLTVRRRRASEIS